MGPQNGVMGDSSPMELPQTQVDESQLVEMNKAAKFSKTKEWQELKKHFENRIEFYQTYLPNGSAVGATEMTREELGGMWAAANVIIGELNAVIQVYESAAEALKDYAASQQKRT